VAAARWCPARELFRTRGTTRDEPHRRDELTGSANYLDIQNPVDDALDATVEVDDAAGRTALAAS